VSDNPLTDAWGLEKMSEKEQVELERELKKKAIEERDRKAEIEAEVLKRDAALQEEYRQKALIELQYGDPMHLISRAYSFNHFGDKEVVKAVVYAAMLQASSTTKGLQIYLTGEKGSGKSSALKAALHLLPNVLDTSFSSKALFYKPPLEKQSVVIDDARLNEEQVTLLKRCITNFQCNTDHLTVVNKEVKTLSIPRRILWFGTSVLEDGDDQFKDRFMTITIKNSKLDNLEYAKYELQRRSEGRAEYEENEDVGIARHIIKEIHKKEFIVEGLNNIKFAYYHDRRLLNMFLDLVEASAILHWMQREHVVDEVNNIVSVKPNHFDVENAASFQMFNFIDEEAEGRMNRTEKELSDTLQSALGLAVSRQFTESEIASLWGRTLPSVRNVLYGRGGTPLNIVGGLIDKVKWVKVTDPMDRDSKARHVIQVDRHVTNSFSLFAWIEEEESNK
jgi:hypothetical protein